MWFGKREEKKYFNLERPLKELYEKIIHPVSQGNLMTKDMKWHSIEYPLAHSTDANVYFDSASNGTISLWLANLRGKEIFPFTLVRISLLLKPDKVIATWVDFYGKALIFQACDEDICRIKFPKGISSGILHLGILRIETPIRLNPDKSYFQLGVLHKGINYFFRDEWT